MRLSCLNLFRIGRRALRYRLRTLLIAVLLFSVACKWIAVRVDDARARHAAIAEILSADGGVFEPHHYDEEWQAASAGVFINVLLGRDESAEIRGVRFCCERSVPVAALRCFPKLERLSLEGANFTDRDLASVAGLGTLKELYLNRTQITDVGLRDLAHLNELEILYLDETSVTDAGIAWLAGLGHLRELSLSGTRVSGAGLAALSGSTSRLDDLELELCPNLDGSALLALNAIPTLKALKLSHTFIGDASVPAINLQTGLETFIAEGTDLSDAGLERLRLPKLKLLLIAGPDVTGRGITAFCKAHPSLEHLYVSRRAVSDATVQWIRENMHLCSLDFLR